VKYRDLIRLIEKDGWFHVRTNGSHRIYKHPTKSGIAIIAAHGMNQDVPKGILAAALKQVGIEL
jgi:predicted RNA binding protein YcfA (HicA-like mRNA interferase family)